MGSDESLASMADRPTPRVADDPRQAHPALTSVPAVLSLRYYSPHRLPPRTTKSLRQLRI
jgi:hypothetical protein